MPRKRVTAGEQKQRHEWAIRQIDAGMGLSELTALTAQKPGGGLSQNGRDVLPKAHADCIKAFNHTEINRRDLLFQQVGRLERIASKAENCG